MFTHVAELLTFTYVMSYHNLPKFHHFVYPHVEHLVFLAYSRLSLRPFLGELELVVINPWQATN